MYYLAYSNIEQDFGGDLSPEDLNTRHFDVRFLNDSGK